MTDDRPEHHGQHAGHCGKCNAWRFDHPEERRKQDSTGTPRSTSSPKDIGFADLAEAALAILCVERGGRITIPRGRTEAAIQKMQERHPKGVHMHFDNVFGDIEIEVTGVENCNRRNAHPEDQVEWEDGKVTAGAGGYYEVGGERKDPTSVSKAELWQINHAQHVLLTAALERLGGALSTSFAEFQKGAQNTMGQAALSITKNGDELHAAVISLSTEGRA